MNMTSFRSLADQYENASLELIAISRRFLAGDYRAGSDESLLPRVMAAQAEFLEAAKHVFAFDGDGTSSSRLIDGFDRSNMASSEDDPAGKGLQEAFDYRQWDVGIAVVSDGRSYVGGYVATKARFRCSDFSMDGYPSREEALRRIGEKARSAVDKVIALHTDSSCGPDAISEAVISTR